MIKEFAKKHMKSEEIKIDQDLNRQIWKRGKTNPPRKVRVKMVKDEDGMVIVSSYEEAIKAESDTESNKPDSFNESKKKKLRETESAENNTTD
jgi:large subunit ribosomal protein L31e